MKHKLKQKQNQRITRITENTLVVGADIAKKIHVARAVDLRGMELGKECVFHNDREGLTKLTEWILIFLGLTRAVRRESSCLCNDRLYYRIWL